MTIRPLLLAILLLAILLLGGNAEAAPASFPAFGAFGLDLDARMRSTAPGDDFWTHANGAWARRTSIGANVEAAGVSVQMVETANANVRRIVEDMAAGRADAPGGGQIGALYASWMDEAAVESRGVGVLKPYLERIESVADAGDLQALFATAGYASPLAVSVDVHPDDPKRHILVIAQGNLPLARENYLEDGERYVSIRQAYRGYIQHMLQQAGASDASRKADAILALETALAKAQWPAAQSRDLARMNDLRRRSALDAAFPGFDWQRLLAGYELAPDKQVLVNHNTAIAALGRLLAATPLRAWKDYLHYRFIDQHAAFLPSAFADAHFDFYGRTLGGRQSQQQRWQRGVQLVNTVLGEAIGRIYVDRHFTPVARGQVEELVADLRAAFRQRIATSTWMDAATRRAALAKLDAMKAAIGGPDRHPDYGALRLERDDVLGNVIRAAGFALGSEVSRLHRAADPARWVTTPQTMNAFYDQHANTVVFPAAVLQPPFFDPRADAAVNYGAIGALIGHEMGHAFDDQGRHYGPDGAVVDWWTPAASRAFERRAAALSAQFGRYEVLPGVRIDPVLTQGENIADLSGVEAAYAAYQRYQARRGKAPVLAGLSGEQRFFLAFAQGRRAKLTESAQRQLLLVDTHSPSLFRVNGTLRNIDGWYRAFQVAPGAAFYLPPERRVRIW